MIQELNQDSTQCVVGLHLQRLVGIKCDVVDGSMWHSAASPAGKNAHRLQLVKTEYCQNPNGLPCLQIDRR
eukprot:1774058-Karenia_brevis.AAC.1